MVKYSVIIPVYNRPEEVDELLESLTHQTFTDFEVLIIEDGSARPCEDVVKKYETRLAVTYYFKPNSGQGFSRNFGFERAKGSCFIVFDSDCLIPPHYFQAVETALAQCGFDAFGGPDRAHESFTDLQKAISYSMTSFFTTGGIRGSKKAIGGFHPRSFNMGISRVVYEKTKGYIITRMGEDIEFSIRIQANGFSTGLIEEAYVYHKRRTSFSQFWKQLHFFGRARINISRFFPSELKPVHTLPAFFVLAEGCYLISPWVHLPTFYLGSSLLAIFATAIAIDSTLLNKSSKVGVLSVGAAFVQLTAYGVGFWTELGKRIRGK